MVVVEVLDAAMEAADMETVVVADVAAATTEEAALVSTSPIMVNV